MSLRPTPAKLRLCGRRNGRRVGAAAAGAAFGAFGGVVTSCVRTGLAAVAALARVFFDAAFFSAIVRNPTPSPRIYSVPGYRPWHFLYFLPLPHQHGSLRPSLSAPTGAVLPWPPLGLPAVAVATPA